MGQVACDRKDGGGGWIWILTHNEREIRSSRTPQKWVCGGIID